MPKKIFILLILVTLMGVVYQCSLGKNNIISQKESSIMEKNIIEAVSEDNIEKVRELLKENININTQDSQNRTLLMIAAYNNNYKIAKLLIDNGADVNIQDDMKNNPFLYSGAEGQLEILKILIKAGADTKITNRYGGVALIPASEHGYVDTVKYLLENTDIDVNHINNLGWTALLEAIILGNGSDNHKKVIELLLKHGADPNIADKDGVTPLTHARKKAYKDIEKIIINYGGK